MWHRTDSCLYGATFTGSGPPQPGPPRPAAGWRPDERAGRVIHTEDLTKVYAGTDFAAVDKLNLDVRAGEILGLLGPNGAGKTTTAGMLTNPGRPDVGARLPGGRGPPITTTWRGPTGFT